MVAKMSTQSEQNGRRPPLPVQSVAPSDPRTRNLPSSDPHVKVCRDYVWGICNKSQCKFRHECTFEEMKSIIKFCHDHQNRPGCSRPDCTYLHTSNEEENLFITTGRLPRVLLERHAANNVAASARFMPHNVSANVSASAMDGVPPPFVSQPPPPPPPLPMTLSAPPPPPPQPMPSVLPPPPPPPPPTEPSQVVSLSSPLYTVPPIQNASTAIFPLNQPPPPMFDTSRPPPPLPANLRNTAIKRSIADTCEAGPSKLRKRDDASLADNMCENCVQRELSSNLCMEEVETLNRQREYKKLLLKRKVEETENMKAIIRFLFPTEIGLELEEYIDGMSNPSFGLSVPMQLMLHRLLEDRISSSSNVMDSIQSSSSMEELFLGCLLNSTVTTDRSPTTESRPSDILSSSADITRPSTSMASNGLSRFVNGQRIGSNPPPVAPPVPPVPSIPPVPPPTHRPMYPGTSSSGPRAYTSAGVSGAGAGPMGAAQAVPTAAPAPPAPGTGYAVYQPAVPPPTHRPCYTYIPTSVGGSPVTSTPYFAPMPRMAGPQPPAPLPATAAAPAPPAPPPVGPSNGHTYNPYMMAGYPSSHYYPPYQ